MKLDIAVRQLHRTENHLAGVLRALAGQHKVDHEVFHVCHDLARWSASHVAELAHAATSLGLDLSPAVDDDPQVLEEARQDAAELLAHQEDPGLLLLADLRYLYKEASGAVVDWELLAQGARAGRHQDLAALAARCSPQTQRQATWAKSYLKVASPQVLVS